MLEVLASVQNCPGRDFAALEHLVLNHISAVSGCICVLQRWDGPRRHLVKTLRGAGIPLLVLVLARPGEKPRAASPEDGPEACHILELGKIEQQLAQLS
jgi:hypothetical protein